MKNTLSRRRFLTISAASLTCGGTAVRAASKQTWSGRAMGAEVSMTLAGQMPEAEARSVFRAVERELVRLERIFSLYQTKSQIVQLNRSGMVRAPAPELLEVLSLCGALHAATDGAFDPTVQPLWLAHARAATEARVLSPEEQDALRERTGWQHLRIDTGEIRFERPGHALTLNGIAQGYITDRIVSLLRQRGLNDILVDMGEIAALGPRHWQVGIAMPGGELVERITLRDRAVATSAPLGTMLSSETQLGHILDPRKNAFDPKHRLISVSADAAALADGLSTAFCLMPRAEIDTCLSQFTDAKLETIT